MEQLVNPVKMVLSANAYRILVDHTAMVNIWISVDLYIYILLNYIDWFIYLHFIKLYF